MSVVGITSSIPQRLSIREIALNHADRFVPRTVDGQELPFQEALRLRTGIVIAWLGVVLSASTALLYAYIGSPISGLAIGAITVPLLFLHLAVRRGTSLTTLGNAFTTGAWLMTFVVAARTGGFQSPALVWSFIHPITTYVACGKRSAQVWALLCTGQVATFFTLNQLGLQAAQDLAPSTATVLRAAGFIGCILTNMALIAAIEGCASLRRRRWTTRTAPSNARGSWVICTTGSGASCSAFPPSCGRRRRRRSKSRSAVSPGLQATRR